MGIKSKLNLTVILLIILLSLISSIYAITGSIGNARMILRLNGGEEIEKYVLVKNVNNITVDIEIIVDGDLKDYIDIKEDKFTLAPGDEKKAYFTIKAAKPDVTESKINVKFIPKDGKNGVGLSSTIIVIVKGDRNILNDFFDWFNNDKEESNEDNKINDNNTISVGVKKDEDDSKSKNSKISEFNINYLIIMLTITTILFLLLFLLLFYLKSNRHDKMKGVKISKLKNSVQRR